MLIKMLTDLLIVGLLYHRQYQEPQTAGQLLPQSTLSSMQAKMASCVLATVLQQITSCLCFSVVSSLIYPVH